MATMNNTVKELPILMSAPMVRTTLRQVDPKTQTRRGITRLAGFGAVTEFGPSDTPGYDWHFRDKKMRWHDISHARLLECCPYGQPGDRLWVRETWAQPAALDPGPTVYRADYPACVPAGYTNLPAVDEITWKPSIHMFRRDSRILLEVVSVRVERLQDISEQDAVSEGIGIVTDYMRSQAAYGMYFCWMPDGKIHYGDNAVDLYRRLWEQLNGAGSWDANPWVWVVEFKRVLP